ncbi:MAG: hypothetical protein U0836_12015 [Pirellulales bacterium]
MHPACLIVALTLGVDVGWRPLPEGGLEYIIQIEPELLRSLERGQPIASDVPLILRDIRRYRIQVGNGPLPQEGPLDAPQPGAEPEARRPATLPGPAASGELEEAPRFVAQAPRAAPPARAQQPTPAAAAPASPQADESAAANTAAAEEKSAAEETVDPFAGDNAEPTPAAVEPTADVPPPSEDKDAAKDVEEDGPFLSAKAAEEAAAAPTVADQSPQLPTEASAADKLAKSDAPSERTVQKVTDGLPAGDDPPLRGGEAAGQRGSGSASEAAAPAEPDKPWVWLTLALMGLAASTTVNVYQGLLHLNLRTKYRALVRKLHDVTAQRDELAQVDPGWPDEQASIETVRAEDYEED